MKARILKQHGIKVIKLANGTTIADTDGELVNITSWALNKLYSWLGY